MSARGAGSEMGPIWLVVRSELGRRPLSVLTLAGLTAAVTFVLAAGVGGATRTATVLERFTDRTATSQIKINALSPELAMDPNAGVRLADALAAVPGVEDTGVVAGFPLDIDDDYFMVQSSLDGSTYIDADRTLVTEGHLPVGAEEVAINRTAAATLDLDIGDTVSGPTLRTEDMERIFGGEGFPGFVGEELELEVVGYIERGEDLSGRSTATGLTAVASPEFAATYGDRVGSYVTEVRLRTTDTSPALLGALRRVAAREVGDFEIGVQTTDEAWADDTRDGHRMLALSIASFTAVAALAGALVLTQALSREVSQAGRHDQALRVIGATRQGRSMAASGTALIAVGSGLVVGVAAAVAVSGVFPIGQARRAEVAPGVMFDARAALAAVVLGVLAAGWTAWTAFRLTRAPHRDTQGRRSRLAGVATRAGLRPSSVVGVRFAVEPGGGPGAVPVRSALLGAIAAVASVTAVVVVSQTADAVAAAPERYGWVWSTLPDSLADDPDAAAALAAEAEGVDALAALWFTTASINGDPIPAAALDPVRGSMVFAQIEGRQPTGPTELALSRGTAEELGVEIGDTVTLDGAQSASPVAFELVGTIVAPPIDDIRHQVVLSPEGIDAVAQSEPTAYTAIRYVPDADQSEVEHRLETIGFRFTPSSRPDAPSQVDQFLLVRPLAATLVGLVALLGAIGLLHFLMATVLRRSSDIAVLRALGFQQHDVHRSIRWQAITAAATGLIVGIPLGVAAGRFAWKLAVSSIDIADDPSTPWPLLATVVVAGMLGALVIAVVPGWVASRWSIAGTLRSE